MKTQSLIFRYIFVTLVAILFGANIIHAQIVFKENSIDIGSPKFPTFLNVKIKGLNGAYWTCKNDSNFFQLDISPANPRIAGTKNRVVFYNTKARTYNNIMVANVYNSSDARAKTNINNLTGGLTDILRLRPVSYNWKAPATKAVAASDSATASASIGYGPDPDRMQYGFLAQEVEEIIPDIVHTDEEGSKSINYIALIPMLVQSIQELQATVDEQNTVIENLSSRVGGSALKQSAKTDYIVSCTPNPTKGEITFTYNIGTTGSKATIIISNLTGTRVRSLDCSSATAVTANLSSLTDGIYLATLVVDNNVRDSKQIVVSK